MAATAVIVTVSGIGEGARPHAATRITLPIAYNFEIFRLEGQSRRSIVNATPWHLTQRTATISGLAAVPELYFYRLTSHLADHKWLLDQYVVA